MLVNVNTR